MNQMVIDSTNCYIAKVLSLSLSLCVILKQCLGSSKVYFELIRIIYVYTYIAKLLVLFYLMID